MTTRASKCRLLTSASIKQLYAVMTQGYDTEIVYKGAAAEMKAVAAFLDAIGIMDSKAFMKSYAVTIDHRIYLPYALGASKPSLISQAIGCAHEHQHICVMEDEGYAGYYLLYVGSPAKRAMFEARCYQADAEVYWWWKKATTGVGLLPDINLDKALTDYGCDKGARAPAVKAYAKACKVIQKGGIGCGAAQDVIRFYGWMEV